jgi:hypothetical protein
MRPVPLSVQRYGWLQDHLNQRFFSEVFHCKIVGITNHVTEGLPAGIPNEGHGVPLLARLANEGPSAVSGIDDLKTVPCTYAAELPDVCHVTLPPSVRAEAEQIEHYHRAAGILGEEPFEFSVRPVDHDVSISVGTLMSRTPDRVHKRAQDFTTCRR